MKLADLRRLAIRKQLKIHFKLRSGLECVVDEHGVARAPELKSVPDFNFEDELAAAEEFLIEPAAPAPPRKISRAEMTSMAAAAPGAAVVHDHDED